jgi:Family of unknown function (DUF6502)
MGETTVSEPFDDVPLATRQAVMAVLEPMAALLMSRQMRYAEAETLLKAAFVQAASQSFKDAGQQPSASNVSVATGLHRRDVTQLMEQPLPSSPRKVPMASQARLLWITHPQYLDSHGQPRRLPRNAPAGEASFTQLAASISKDIHAKALLDEMVRIGMAEEDDDHVALRHRLFSHSPTQAAAMDVAGANLGDHIAAVAHNLQGKEPALPERAIHADGLTETSARRAAELARDIWARSLSELREKLQALVELDANAPGRDWRVRIGLYGYCAEQAASTSPEAKASEPSPNTKRPRGRPPKQPQGRKAQP